MGELERYGLLSLASILVLFLVLTFVGRQPESREEIVRAAAGGASELAANDPARSGAPGRDSRRWPSRPPPNAERSEPPAQPGPAAGNAAQARPPLSHVVRQGETLSGIAAKYLGSSRRWPELVAANAPLDPLKLRIGKVLRIPDSRRKPLPGADTRAAEADSGSAPEPKQSERPKATTRSVPVSSAREHVVKAGDTLSSISNKYYGDYMQWKRIYRANRKQIPDARQLEVGTILTLP